jgi:hypothetical protein
MADKRKICLTEIKQPATHRHFAARAAEPTYHPPPHHSFYPLARMILALLDG